MLLCSLKNWKKPWIHGTVFIPLIAMETSLLLLDPNTSAVQVEVAPIPTPKEGVAGAEHAAAVGEAQGWGWGEVAACGGCFSGPRYGFGLKIRVCHRY